MAEQTSGVENKKLLLVALALGLLMVLIYNVHVTQVKLAGKGKEVILLKADHDLKEGSKITPKNIKKEVISASLVGGMTGLIVLETDKDLDRYTSEVLNQNVEKDSYLMYQHIQKDQGRLPSARIRPDMVACPLVTDPALAPGEILRPGDHVNILGEFQFSGQRRKYYRIIKAVRVHTVGGRSAGALTSTGETSFGPQGATSYRTITVEVTPDVALKLADVTRGITVRIEVISSDPRATELSGDVPRIDPEFEQLAKSSKLLD
jgi:Flp pilus assembly protein CpaB